MQITTLNKIINLFLVGIIAMGMTLYLFSAQAVQFLSSSQLPPIIKDSIGPIGSVFGAVVLLSFSVFFGVLVDAASEWLVRSFIVKKAIENSRLLRIAFRTQRQYTLTHDLRKRFREQLVVNKKYRNLAANDEEEDKAFGSAIFFETAKAENVDWLTQVYSVYLLATSFVLIIIVLTIVCPILHAFGIPIKTLPLDWYIPFMFAVYFFLYLGAHRRLFSYEIVYRHGLLTLSSTNYIQEAKPVTNTGAVTMSEVETINGKK
jgi:hypothetical protein